METYELDIALPPKQPGYAALNKKHLTFETIAAINEYAKKDFELFGYNMVQSNAEFT